MSPAAAEAAVLGVSHFTARPLAPSRGSSSRICGTPGLPSGCQRGHTSAPAPSPPIRVVTARP